MSWNSRRSKQYYNHQQQQQQRQQQHWVAPPSISRPPLPPGFSPVPSWEKRFCTNVCRIPWRRLCEAKELMGIYKNVIEWDDLEAREAFHNAKARYWAEINGWHSDIAVPDPNLYIDKVDYDARIDPELVADLEEQPLPPGIKCKDDISGVDSLDRPVKASGWNDGEAPKGERTTSWDVHLDWSIVPTGWGDAEDGNPADDSNNRGIYLTAWDIDTWEQRKKASNNWDSGWDAGCRQTDSWIREKEAWNVGNIGSRSNGRDSSWNSRKVTSQTDGSAYKISQNSSWGHYDNRNLETDRKYAKKRDRGGSFGSRFTKSRYQIHDQQTNNTRKNRGRSGHIYPYELVA